MKSRAPVLVALAVAAFAVGCRDRGKPPELVDLTDSLYPMRNAFNARKGQTRFLAVLAPT